VSVKTQNNAPWGLGRISSGAKLPATGPYKYKFNDASNGNGVIAYVIDTGINDKHVPGTVTDENDNQGHGTHCAGTIGSNDYGVAKDVEIVGIKVFNDLPERDPLAGATNADIMAALDYVVKEFQRHKQPSVVNLSLGGGPSDALDNTVAAAVRAGVLVCCAAGNADAPRLSPYVFRHLESGCLLTFVSERCLDNFACQNAFGCDGRGQRRHGFDCRLQLLRKV
jgi:subtilisin family serine protease